MSEARGAPRSGDRAAISIERPTTKFVAHRFRPEAARMSEARGAPRSGDRAANAIVRPTTRPVEPSGLKEAAEEHP